VNARLEQFRNQPPLEVCILRLSAIGDTCHALPVVRTLQRAWPRTRFTWVIGKTEASLMSGIDGVDLAVLDKSAGAGGFLDMRQRLAGRRFDLLLMMHASLRANLTSLMIRARVRLGFDRPRARDYQYLFSNARIAARPHEHVMDGLFGFAEALGVSERLLGDMPSATRIALSHHVTSARRPRPGHQPVPASAFTYATGASRTTLRLRSTRAGSRARESHRGPTGLEAITPGASAAWPGRARQSTWSEDNTQAALALLDRGCWSARTPGRRIWRPPWARR
jgi:hypothetical protein